MGHEVESLVLTDGQPAWHKLGVVLPSKALHSDEVLRYAGLDWSANQESIFHHDADGRMVEIPGWKAVVRDSDNSVLGIQTDEYKPVQPSDLTAALDTLVDSGEAFYKTAGSLKKGRLIFFLVEPPTDCWIAGEQHLKYIFARTSFDGSSATAFKTTMVRVLCNNTFQNAVLGGGREITFRHVGDMSERLEEARRVLGLAEVSWQRMADNAEKLAMLKMNDHQFDGFVNHMFPIRGDSQRSKTIAINKRAKVHEIYARSDDLNNIRGTKWGALNAVVAWNDHYVNRRATKLNSSAANRTQSIFMAKGYPQKAALLLSRP